jgi:hypothetical protein
MDNLEHHLRKASLEKPSAIHDAAMQRIFTEAQLRRPTLWSTNIALWKCAAACILCLSFGYLLHAYLEPPRAVQPPPPSAVYIIPPDPALSGLFDATQRQQQIPTLDASKVRVHLSPASDNTLQPAEGSA